MGLIGIKPIKDGLFGIPKCIPKKICKMVIRI